MVMISAHRCGAGADTHLENTRTALERAVTLPVEYVEFDVQRCADETFVLFHDDHIEIDGTRVPLSSLTYEQFAARADHFLRYDEVLEVLAAHGKRAHIDFKFVSDKATYRHPERTHEVAATQVALRHLSAQDIIVTSLEDRSVRAVRRWSDAAGVDLLVGLSLGRDMPDAASWRRVLVRTSELFPALRYRLSRANLVVVNLRLARLTVARFARRRRLPMLVWTVDDDAELQRWLAPGAAWLVTTNYPERAIEIRDRVRSPQGRDA
jgi:glycerophosphoryl diester phosphodiesterase